MAIARVLIGLLLFSSVVCFAFSIATGHPGWRRWGITILKWTLAAGLVFFSVLIIQALVEMP